MTTEDGVQKGLRCVLEERSVNTHGMKAKEMRDELRKFEDFQSDGVPLVEEMVTGRGHMCVFIPKFHCELNPIERCWCHAKKFTIGHTLQWFTCIRNSDQDCTGRAGFCEH